MKKRGARRSELVKYGLFWPSDNHKWLKQDFESSMLYDNLAISKRWKFLYLMLWSSNNASKMHIAERGEEIVIKNWHLHPKGYQVKSRAEKADGQKADKNLSTPFLMDNFFQK
jgi:hypothetical protein